MCGICGATADWQGKAVGAMNDAMVYRGPDDEGTYVDPAVGLALGARRLSVIDVEGGHQPLANEDGTIWAVLNGEIYNHPSVRSHLVARGHRFATGTDTEVLVHLYEEFGDAMVHAMEGMFAFAIWDSRERRLVVARDRFGEKPLFYREEGGELLFASELTALLASRRFSFEIDPAAVHNFFVFGYLSGEWSMAQGVSQLLPGHVLSWDDASKAVSTRAYWEPPGYARGSTSGSLKELAGEARQLLEQSVRARLIADVPVGVFLSGGVDSTLVAALAAEASSKPVKTFTVGYDRGNVSEVEPAAQTAAELGTIHHELVLTESDVVETIPPLLSQLDQPLADQSLIALHAVAAFARREVTVVIGGEGADELFGGYPRYWWMQQSDHVRRVVPAPIAVFGEAMVEAVAPPGRARRLVHLLERDDVLQRHINWVTDRRREHRNDIYGPALRWAVGTTLALDSMRALVGQRLGESLANGPAGGLMLLDQMHWLPGDVLAKADRASMLCSLELRTPFLSRELAEFAASVSADLHVRRRGKALLRCILDDIVPGSTLTRDKTAFRVPAPTWLRGSLAPVLRRQVEAGSLYRDGWFNRGAVGRMADDHIAGVSDWTHILWPLLALGLWMDRVTGTDD